MEQPNTLPQWLTITGQSGVGKGTAIEYILGKYTEYNIPHLFIGNGDLFRAYSEKDSYTAKVMKDLNTQALPQPMAMSIMVWWSRICQALDENPNVHIIHDGSPRRIGEAHLIAELVQAGYIASCTVLEIFAPDEICAMRLAKRTKKDRRIDLSLPDNPGEPDKDKILTKLAWWSKDREAIVSEIKKSGLSYECVRNTGAIEQFKKEIDLIFF